MPLLLRAHLYGADQNRRARLSNFGEIRTRSAGVSSASVTALWSPDSMSTGCPNKKPAGAFTSAGQRALEPSFGSLGYGGSGGIPLPPQPPGVCGQTLPVT